MTAEKEKILFGLPKGSLEEATFRLFKGAGFELSVENRSYSVKINASDFECYLLRPQEIPKYIKQGKLTAGISGEDCVLESRAKIKKICDLFYQKKTFGKIKIVLAVHRDSPFQTIRDLEGKIISTEWINIATDYLKKKGINAKVEFSWGATEVKPPLFADAIIDLSETGESLKVNNLRIIDIVAETSTCLFCSKSAWQNRVIRKKLQDLAFLLQGTAQSEQLVGVMAHLKEEQTGRAVAFLQKQGKEPSLRKTAGEKWLDLSFTCNSRQARDILPRLKELGLADIIEYPVGKAI